MLNPDRLCFIAVCGAGKFTIGLPYLVAKTKNGIGHSPKERLTAPVEHQKKNLFHQVLVTDELKTDAKHIIETVHILMREKATETVIMTRTL